ncbi:MAG: histidine phosphatase family protein [Alphaproteobacteria bacterium]|nr:histidine phosphatase family protein [Alphaproteobacteria bacterium]MCD8570214.1 histidine phosphatase family protein [Alphaproteobacteria bacterium]
MTTLIIARHGNTFGPDDIVTYVGGRTDLPLVEKGVEQAKAIGRYLKDNRLIPDVVYSSTLQRTQETARIAVKESGVTNPVFPLEIFNEIDYGPDENQPADKVKARIGEEALKHWEEEGLPPPGWMVDPVQIIKNWQGFADQVCAHDDGEVALVVTSNGIARFAPYITGDYEGFRECFSPKLATGALGILTHTGGRWLVKEWGLKP